MKKIRNRFRQLKLNVKFIIVCLACVMLPMVGLSLWLFWSMEDNVIEEKKSAMDYMLSREYGQIVKNVDAINLSTQFFLSDQSLRDFLRAQTNGEAYPEDALMEFYSRDIAALDRMVDNNTSLYQVRVYADVKNLRERLPVLYSRERMEGQPWAQDEKVPGWKFGYEDGIPVNYGLQRDRKILSLVTFMESDGEEELGIIEAAMYMDVMFPLVYDSKEGEWSCFADGSGSFYFADGFDTPENRAYVEEILSGAGSGVSDIYLEDTGKGKSIAGYRVIKELGGVLVSVNDIGEDLKHIYRQRIWFILIGAAAMIFMTIVVSWINKMLVNIRQLTDDNLNHELLVKNTQIRALQNQINAHFIYNVLESVKMMAEINEEYDISDAITALGSLLRYSMKWTSGNVTVGEEMEYIRNYLRLINLRFDYEIYLFENIPDSIMKQEIPKMSLQPIVENAIYHGIEQIAEDTSIYMKGFMEGKDCIIEITDAGRGMSSEEVEELYKKINGELEASGGSGNGIGLKNVQDRIKMNFGEGYGIEIASKLGCYTKIRVRIPSI